MSGVQIYEPIQRAMIAWNGDEEILLLTTDLRASDTSKVLEILPLPSEPTVKKGEFKTLEKAIQLINRKTHRVIARGEKGIPLPGGELRFHKKIGSHNISVIHLINAEKFIEWVEDYLKKAGYEKIEISDKMKNLVGQYIKDGFEWFVFDIISLQKELQSRVPIQYQFKTKNLFFPLRITNTNSGNTTIRLLILTPRLLSRFPGLPVKNIKLVHRPITIDDKELEELNKDMFYLLKNYKKLKLRIWRISAPLESFAQDLIAR